MLDAPKAKLSLSGVPDEAQEEAAPIQNRPVCIQQSADFTSLLVWFLPQKELNIRVTLPLSSLWVGREVAVGEDELSGAVMLSI